MGAPAATASTPMGSARTSGFAREVEQEEVGLLAGIDTHRGALAVAVVFDVGRPVVVLEQADTHAASTTSSRAREALGAGSASRARATTAAAPPSAWCWGWHRGAGGAASLTSRERSVEPGQGMTDPIDAVPIARITARETDLPPVRDRKSTRLNSSHANI